MDAMQFAHLLTRQTSRATQGPLSSLTLVTEPQSVAEPLLWLSVDVSLSPEKFKHALWKALIFQAF